MEDVTISLREKGFDLYMSSVRRVDGTRVFVARKEGRKWVGVAGDTTLGMTAAVTLPDGVALCELNWENYQALSKHIPLKPSTTDHTGTFGVGDRLGMATAAHLSVLGRYDTFPVPAQQSPRELERTGRSFKGVLLDAVMGVLESGYEGAFGADADHIKDERRLEEALEAGYSMYTLDVGDELRDPAGLKPAEEAAGLTAESRKVIRAGTGRTLRARHVDVRLSGAELTRSALIYEKAMLKAAEWYTSAKMKVGALDLEISIDEGGRRTTFEDHFYVAEFLHAKGVDFRSLAPRFPGEFQKAVDFRGDMDTLSRAMYGHAALAREIEGYRLSLHSGSDKFSIYPLLAEAGMGCFHVKTSGTSWLEAVKVIAVKKTSLFSEMYQLSAAELNESKKAYQVDIEPKDFPAEVPADVSSFFSRPDVRQLFHISYGVLFGAFRERIVAALQADEELHYSFVAGHIDRHLKLLFG